MDNINIITYPEDLEGTEAEVEAEVQITHKDSKAQKISNNNKVYAAPPAGHIQDSYTEKVRNELKHWQDLDNSRFACKILSEGLKLNFRNKSYVDKSLRCYCPCRSYNKTKSLILKEEVSRLVELGVLMPVPRNTKVFTSYIFFNVKPNGKIRLIFDMKVLNSFLRLPSFKMLQLKHIFPYFHMYNWSCKIDLKDAYWHVPICDEYQKYLAFEFSKVKYVWKCMPFWT